jgi:hypothetical protein
MKSELLSVQQACESIRQGKRLLLAGDEQLLSMLPRGAWIAGTTCYFMTSTHALCTQEHVFAVELPEEVQDVSIVELDASKLPDIYTNMPANGFGIVIMPAGCKVHSDFAMNAPFYSNFASSPLAGWVSGPRIAGSMHSAPKVFSGASESSITDRAVVLYASLPPDRYAEIEILNLFQPGDGDRISFDEPGFNARTARINGREQSFAAYITERSLDMRIPLVADYAGAKINISFNKVDLDSDSVSFYAPVFPGVSYRQAKPVSDYVSSFCANMPTGQEHRMVFSCNCCLNYMYSELEGKSTGGIAGPITFGEIAYQLLNQTMVYLTLGTM